VGSVSVVIHPMEVAVHKIPFYGLSGTVGEILFLYGRKLATEVVSHITSVLMVWRMEPTGSNNGVVQISVANESVPAFKNIFKV